MVTLKRVVLDVLKPHHPDVLALGRLLADQGTQRVRVIVREVDEQTETLQIEIEGSAIDFERIQAVISDFGASLHSIDEVEMEGDG